MGRAPCCDKANVKRGPWSPEEDAKLKEYIDKHGTGGNWIALPQKAGLRRCGKSCRLRWLNYLRPNIRHGEFSDDEDRIISTLFANIGSRWSIIAAQLPGRTDNDIKNYWNTKLKKKLLTGSSSSLIMVPPLAHKIRPQYSSMTTYQPSISFLQSPSSSSSPSPPPYSSPSPHNTSNNNNNNNYSSTLATTARSPFTGNYYDYDPSSMSNITPSSSNNQLLMHLQTQHGFVSPMQNLYSQGKHSSPLIMFGDQTPAPAAADANSCSSSDGSNCNNKDQVEHERQFMMFSNGATGNNIIDGNNVPEKQINGWLLNGGDQTPLDHYYNSLEEIKQLISSSNMISCNSNLNFFVDENKTSDHQEAEKVILYY